MAARPTYKLDYSPDRGIIVSGPGTDPREFPINQPGNDSPLTLYRYDPNNPDRISQQGVNASNFTHTQRMIRIWDMMKDGYNSLPMNKEIWCLMTTSNDEDEYPSFGDFKTLRNGLLKLPHISSKIIQSTWIKPNLYETDHAKLGTRHAYQESGISPNFIIHDPTYVINIANTIIDPLRRSLHGPQPVYFPGKDNSLAITSEFFKFMGFVDCSLEDRQPTDSTHDYALTLAPGITVTEHNIPAPPYRHNKGWYAGNATKNDYFASCPARPPTSASSRCPSPPNQPAQCSDNYKKAVLNVKELGDVLQVLLMFIKGALDDAHQQTMVTCDSVVFMLCITLGLDCAYYQHIPNGPNHIYHFNAKYTLVQAKTHFDKVKEEIIKHNQAQIDALLYLINVKPKISIPGSGNLVEQFYFCDEFLNHIIADMTKINNALTLVNSDDLIDSASDDTTNIARLNNYAMLLKVYYKIKILFSNASLQFRGTYHAYTEKPTPATAEDFKEIRPIQQIISLPDEQSNPSLNSNPNNSASQNNSAPQNNSASQQNHQAERECGIFERHLSSSNPTHTINDWELKDYGRGVPFYSIYTRHYVGKFSNCMHPTEIQHEIRQVSQYKSQRNMARNEAQRQREEQYDSIVKEISEETAKCIYPDIYKRRQKEKRNALKRGTLKRARENNNQNNQNKQANEKRQKIGGANNITRKNNKLSKFSIFELDLTSEVLYFEKADTNQNAGPIDIHKEWVHTLEKCITTFFNNHAIITSFSKMYKNDFYRDMYEFCDTYNVVLTGAALVKVAYEKLNKIMELHTIMHRPSNIVQQPARRMFNVSKRINQNRTTAKRSASFLPKTSRLSKLPFKNQKQVIQSILRMTPLEQRKTIQHYSITPTQWNYITKNIKKNSTRKQRNLVYTPNRPTKHIKYSITGRKLFDEHY